VEAGGEDVEEEEALEGAQVAGLEEEGAELRVQVLLNPGTLAGAGSGRRRSNLAEFGGMAVVAQPLYLRKGK
jgi:hypothetical protein